MRAAFLSILFFVSVFKGQAQNTGLDPSFANGGIMLSSAFTGGITRIGLQSDLKIVTVGGWRRYTTDGIADSSFSGVFPHVISKYIIAIQPDDKILGAAELFLSRLNSNGIIDTSFGVNGIARYFNNPFHPGILSPEAILIQPDGKIVVIGSGNGECCDSLTGGLKEAVILLRYYTDGRVDSSFGENGIVRDVGLTPHYDFEAKGAALQPDGKIVVGIRESTIGDVAFTTSRYMPDGKHDTAFGTSGYARAVGLSVLNAIALQPNGKIALAGTSQYGWGDNPPGFPFLLARFNADGSPDTDLGPDGIRWYYWDDDPAQNKCGVMIALPDNKLLLGGNAWNAAERSIDFALLRLLPDGTPDPDFGTGGKLRTRIYAERDGIETLALQPDGKILAGGASHLSPVLLRYMPDGKTLHEPAQDNKLFKLYPNPVKDKVYIESAVTVTHKMLSDMSGRVIYSNNDGSREIDLQSLTAGIYILSVTDATNSTERFKIVKQ